MKHHRPLPEGPLVPPRPAQVTAPWACLRAGWPRAQPARPGRFWVEPWQPGHRLCVQGTAADPACRTLPWACGRQAPRLWRTPTARTRPSPGAWPSRPCSLRRTPSRVRIPGPSPLRSLCSVRDHRTHRAGPGAKLRPASDSAVHRRVLIGRSSQSDPAFPAV